MKFSAKGQPEKAATVKKENQKNEWTAVGSNVRGLCRCCGPVPSTRVFPEEEGHDCPSCSRKAGTQEGKAMAAARGV